jgi:hypothetical protein
MLSYLILPGLICSSSLNNNNNKTKTCKHYGLYNVHILWVCTVLVNKKNHLRCKSCILVRDNQKPLVKSRTNNNNMITKGVTDCIVIATDIVVYIVQKI